MNFKRKVSFIFLFVFLTLILTSAVLAEGKIDRKKVKPLKWMGPGKPDTYKQYMARRPKGPFKIKRADNCDLPVQRFWKVMVIAEGIIYPDLESEIQRYANSLIECGYDAQVYQISHGTVEDLKNFIIENSQPGLIGCVFIGDLPAAWYKVTNDYGEDDPASFPCDLFLMDLDGTWIDSDSDGEYDSHTDGSGDRKPEIFVGRIDLSKMPGNEVDNLRNFFDRDNDYWTGNMELLKKGLTYTDIPYTDIPDERLYEDLVHSIEYLYGGDNYEWIDAETNKTDYLDNRLANINYEFIQIACHSNATLHQFYEGETCDYYDLHTVPPQFLGINMFGCSANLFTVEKFLGGAYLHHEGPKALSVIGSTKTGSMLDFNLFYTSLGHNKSMGVAFKEWFEAIIAQYEPDDIIYWHYGMAVVGDPMISFLSFCPSYYPHADFVARFNFPCVEFEDRSEAPGAPIESRVWTFEGGTPSSSTEQNPVICYYTPGTYTVSLTVTNPLGSDTETKTEYIIVPEIQPPIADFSASSTNIHQGESVNYTDTSINNPTSWDWTFEGGTPGTSTEQNPTITYNTPGTYTVTLIAANSAGSDTETKVDYIFVYCASQGNDFNYEWIERVQVADLDNSSGASGYTDFTYLTSNMDAGAAVNVSLTPGFSGSTYTEYWKIWIDYNGDNDFEDAGEEVFSGSGSSTVSGSFTVPSGTCGVVTRMRVSMSYSTYPPICGTFTYGEVEDYTANISGACTQYTLTVNTVGQGSVTLNPPGGVYDAGTVVTLTATPDSGWKFDNWSGDLTGSINPDTITMNANKTVTANFSEIGNCTETVGNTTVFGTSTTTANRRAMPFTMPENGEICSVTMYHNGGSGSMILGVYDGESLPDNRLGVTASTPVSGTTGWQTIDLTSPAFVASGAKIWLAWVYQSNPGMYYESGSPGRASSSQTWSGGMPDPFGSSTTANYIYSIYANYTPSAPPQYTLTVNIVGNGSVALNPPGGVYDAGTVVTLTATPDSGWIFSSWSGDLSGSTNPTTITMNSNKTVTATFIEEGTTGTVGYETVFGSTSVSGYRRALPFTMPENGTITSVTIYHTGGSGDMILGVYDGASTPQNRLAVTPTTAVSGSTGWQTINLTGSAYVSGGNNVWLAWVYESNPGIRYQTGSPGRYQSGETWSGGMPDPFGSGSQTSYIYSIYATYNK